MIKQHGVINLVWIDDNIESRGDGEEEMAEFDDDGSPEWCEFHLSVSDHLQQKQIFNLLTVND